MSSMMWNPRSGDLIVTGGFTVVDSYERPNRDVWHFKFNGPTSGTWSKDTGPFSYCASTVSAGAVMAFDVPSGAKVFFGGFQDFPHTVAVANTTFCD
jgi:hypothetical protein